MESALLFYITLKSLAKKYDDPRKSLENWKCISELYDTVFAVNQWDNLNRFRIENDVDVDQSFQKIINHIEGYYNGLQRISRKIR